MAGTGRCYGASFLTEAGYRRCQNGLRADVNAAGCAIYAALIDDDDAYLCHCRMCQRATGGVAAALKQVPRASVQWEREPDRYASSPIAQRGFCSDCGTPLTYEGEGASGMDLTVGSFDDPYRFRPVSHSGVESWHEPWLDTRGLPSERTDENDRIVAKWKNALDKSSD